MLLRVKILKINEFDVAQQQSLDQTTIQNIVIWQFKFNCTALADGVAHRRTYTLMHIWPHFVIVNCFHGICYPFKFILNKNWISNKRAMVHNPSCGRSLGFPFYSSPVTRFGSIGQFQHRVGTPKWFKWVLSGWCWGCDIQRCQLLRLCYTPTAANRQSRLQKELPRGTNQPSSNQPSSNMHCGISGETENHRNVCYKAIKNSKTESICLKMHFSQTTEVYPMDYYSNKGGPWGNYGTHSGHGGLGWEDINGDPFWTRSSRIIFACKSPAQCQYNSATNKYVLTRGPSFSRLFNSWQILRTFHQILAVHGRNLLCQAAWDRSGAHSSGGYEGPALPGISYPSNMFL